MCIYICVCVCPPLTSTHTTIFTHIHTHISACMHDNTPCIRTFPHNSHPERQRKRAGKHTDTLAFPFQAVLLDPRKLGLDERILLRGCVIETCGGDNGGHATTPVWDTLSHIVSRGRRELSTNRQVHGAGTESPRCN